MLHRPLDIATHCGRSLRLQTINDLPRERLESHHTVLQFSCCAGCVATGEYTPKNIAGKAVHLDDCTDSVSKYMGWNVPQVPQKTRRNLIAAASAWAVDNRFAPCEYRMCATIREYSGAYAPTDSAISRFTPAHSFSPQLQPREIQSPGRLISSQINPICRQ